MKVEEIQKIIDEYYYWDLRVSSLECNYFSDEVKLINDDTEGHNVIYIFKGCYKIHFDHDTLFEKNLEVSSITNAQKLYFLQEAMVSEIREKGKVFYSCNINMYPLNLKILYCAAWHIQHFADFHVRLFKEVIQLAACPPASCVLRLQAVSA